MKAVAAGMNPMDLRRGIDKAVEAVIIGIGAMSRPVGDSDEIARVGTVSANGEASIDWRIADAMARVGKGLDTLNGANRDELAGIRIIRRAIQAPLRQIVEPAGLDGSVIAAKVIEDGGTGFGFDAKSGTYVDMIAAGIIDLTKVVRIALRDAASVAGLLIMTEVMVAEKVGGSAVMADALG